MRACRPSAVETVGLAALLAAGCPALAAAQQQQPVDQADPAVVARQQRDEEERPHRREAPRLAAPAPGQAAATAEPITPGAMYVEGATELAPADFAPAVEPYLGRPLGDEELRALTRDVAEVARRAGFGLATAWVPRQSLVAGVLRVQVDEGRIDAVEVSGNARAAVEARLSGLATGRPLRTAELERRLLLAGDMPGVSLGRAQVVRREGRNILTLEATIDRVRGYASVDNSGSGPVGPIRARLAVDFNSIAIGGDRLSVGGVVTPVQPREFQYGEISYSAPVGRHGTEVSVAAYAGHSDPGASLRDQDVAGLSTQAEVRVTHPLLRSRAASLWGSVGVSVRDSTLDQQGARVRDDRIVTASAVLSGNARVAGGRLRVRLAYVQGLDLLNATARGDPLASRGDAGGPFSKVEFWTEYERSFGGGFGIDLRGAGQLASRPLLASEEMGLGGRQFLRGFDYWEHSGDEGAVISGELRYDMRRGLPGPLTRLQLYLYADAGRVTNLAGGLGGGTLASAGGGVRAWLQHGFQAGVEVGVPLTHGAFDEDPDPRFSFNLGSRF
jgi:hemolysin activation/secretion protein